MNEGAEKRADQALGRSRMSDFIAAKRWLLTIILALSGIGVIVAYITCFGACGSLRGAIFGVDLKYMGILFMGTILLLALLQKPLLLLLLFAFGAGGEIVLIGVQVESGVYCPFCLIFAAIVFLGLALHFDRARKGFTALAAAAGLLFFLLFFSGSTTPAYAAEPPLPAFGTGPVEVRIYTDYFCGPCRGEEAEVMALVAELVQKKLIRVLFIDTPIHRETILFLRYFLAALNADNSGGLRGAIALRAALFDAAAAKIVEKEALESFLKKRKIRFQFYDMAPVFKIFENYLREDKINATPSVVILGPQGKQTLTGAEEILKGLRGLRI